MSQGKRFEIGTYETRSANPLAATVRRSRQDMAHFIPCLVILRTEGDVILFNPLKLIGNHLL
jgi:hypothetical protein